MKFKHIEQYGPSLLDQFAMAAMSGMISSESEENKTLTNSEVAYFAYNIADDMCKERQSRIDLMQDDS